VEDRIILLAEKVESLISLVNELKENNTELKKSNRELKTQLNKAKKEYANINLNDTDRSEKVKVKLNQILNKLEQLEMLAS